MRRLGDKDIDRAEDDNAEVQAERRVRRHNARRSTSEQTNILDI